MLELLVSGSNSDILADFVFFAEPSDARIELGEGDFDGYEVDLGVGLGDEFDEVVAVAIHGNEAAGFFARLEFESLGSAAAVDILIAD